MSDKQIKEGKVLHPDILVAEKMAWHPKLWGVQSEGVEAVIQCKELLLSSSFTLE